MALNELKTLKKQQNITNNLNKSNLLNLNQLRQFAIESEEFNLFKTAQFYLRKVVCLGGGFLLFFTNKTTK